jgi:hypothetical protein
MSRTIQRERKFGKSLTTEKKRERELFINHIFIGVHFLFYLFILS